MTTKYVGLHRRVFIWVLLCGSPIQFPSKAQLYRRPAICQDQGFTRIVAKLIEIVYDQLPERVWIFILTCFRRRIGVKVVATNQEITHSLAHRVAEWNSRCAKVLVVLNSFMVFDAEAQVDGFVFGNVAADDGVEVISRTELNRTDGGRVPSELDFGVWEEWRWCGVGLVDH